MERNEELAKKYQLITESKKAKPIRESEKALFERLLDNEYAYLKEQTFSGDMARLGQILIPVYRRAFPQLVAKDIVGVQPLSQPVGYAFALRYHYSANSAQVAATGTTLGGNTVNSVAGQSQITDNQRTVANSCILVYTTTAARQAEVNDNAANATTYAALVGTTLNSGLVTGFTAAGKVAYTEDNKALLRGLTSTQIASLKASVSGTDSVVTDVYDNEAGYQIIFKNYSGRLATATGEALGTDMEELGLTIDKIPVEAQTRKLKSKYTIESAQDLQSAHGKDMASELIDILTYEITQSIDRDIITSINSAATASTFNLITNSDGRWSMERYRGFYTECIRKSNSIAQTTLRGPGNFIIGHPDVVTILEQMPGFTGIAPIAGNIDTNTPVNNTGTAFVGSIGGRFAVYRDIFATTTQATIGYKGPSSYDAGVIWSPYIPISMKQTVDPESANPIIIFMERSAITNNIFASDKFYRRIVCSNLFDVDFSS